MLLGDAFVAGILPATDLERARGFWKDLGARETYYDEQARQVWFTAGEGTSFSVYERGEPTKAEHTVLGFDVGDLDSTMRDLRGHGVRFEEYDMPGLKTENGVATMGDERAAWFKDSEGNIVSIGEGVRARMLSGAGAMAGRSKSGDMGM